MRKFLWLFAFLTAGFPAAAHPGVGIVMDRRGNVFYTDLKHVWRIAPDGAKSIAVRDVHTHELHIDAQDNLYGEHLWYEGDATKKWGHRVWRLGPDGQLMDVIPAREGFLKGYSFVRDRHGNMYWAEPGPRTVICQRTPDGRVGTLATGHFPNVRWMTATAEGTLFLIDGKDLWRITPDGSVGAVARGLAERRVTQFHVGDHHALMGLWTDAQGRVYVAVYSGRLVKRVAPDGKVTVVARSRPPWSPTGGLVAPNGDLWLLEYSLTNAARVRRVQKSGKVIIY